LVRKPTSCAIGFKCCRRSIITYITLTERATRGVPRSDRTQVWSCWSTIDVVSGPRGRAARTAPGERHGRGPPYLISTRDLAITDPLLLQPHRVAFRHRLPSGTANCRRSGAQESAYIVRKNGERRRRFIGQELEQHGSDVI